MGLESDIEAIRDVQGNLDPGKMTGLLVQAIHGETADPADSSAAPAPAPNTTTEIETPAPAPAASETPSDPAPVVDPAKAVILAKDGVHTIPYSELEQARQAAREATQLAEALRLKLEAATTPAPTQPTPNATASPTPESASPPVSPEKLTELFGDFSEEAMVAGIDKLVDIKVSAITAAIDQRLAPTAAAAEKAAQAAHYTTIYTAHPDADSIAESAELKAFIEQQPSFVRNQYQSVLATGTAAQVVELMTAYKAASGIAPTPSAAPSPASSTPAAPAAAPADPATAARDAIAKAKLPEPMSLSDIPAGAHAAHDEAGIYAGKSTQALMGSLMGKSHDDIMKLMDRVL